MKIENIADHPDLMDTLAQWHEKQWGTVWAEQVRLSTCRERIPTIYIALDSDEPLGTAMLIERDMTTRTELTPWLGGVYVKPSRRGEGVATALVKHAMECAARMGIRQLWLYTPASRKLYELLGWQFEREEDYLGERVTIMRVELPREDVA